MPLNLPMHIQKAFKPRFGISVILIFTDILEFTDIDMAYLNIPPENISRLIFTDIIKLVRYQ